ncbi:hypothetical protein P7C73_g2585, partial [Tremellales sp. Uapishka_1]
MTVTARPKILGIGYPKFALPEFKALEDKYDIHYFIPGARKQVIAEVKRLCDEQGPFAAAYVLFGTAEYSPFHRDMLAPLFAQPGFCGLFSQGGAGYDDVDHLWLAEQGCYLSNTPNAVTEATADMGILLMLAALRGLSESEALCRAGKWREGMVLTEDPAGKTIGFIGLGAIGQAMARKTKPWGMNVIYHNPRPLPPTEEEACSATYVSLDELLSTADIISLNCPLNDQTRGLLDDKAFSKMKDGVFIVNTARGAVIDEQALIRALKSGKVCRAGLDVWTVEPCRESWLFTSPKVTLQPHLGAFTKGTMLKGEREVFANVKQ